MGKRAKYPIIFVENEGYQLKGFGMLSSKIPSLAENDIRNGWDLGEKTSMVELQRWHIHGVFLVVGWLDFGWWRVLAPRDAPRTDSEDKRWLEMVVSGEPRG